MKHPWLSCAAATALAVAIAHPSIAQSTAVNGKIAFTVCETTGAGATCDIWVMNPDGSEQVNLTNTPEANEMNPVWSPDATKIAYVEGFIAVNRLMVMNADGSEQTAVTPDPSSLFGGPTWSPGATQLAFVRMVPGEVISTQFDIIVINVDGSGERNITNTDGDELDPAWSPDGLRIAFAAVRPEQTVNPITGEPETAAQWEIVTSFPDGTDEQIISAGDPDTTRATRLEEDRAPQWSPDGATIVFMSQFNDPCCDPWQIWSVGRDGSNPTLLSDNPAVNDLAPSFSPDGRSIVFTSDRDAEFGGDYDVYSMPFPPSPAPLVTASSVHRLTTVGSATDPNWGREPGTGPPPAFFLAVARLRLGGATGLVVSTPPGIACGRDCLQRYRAGTVVTLIALAGDGSRFLGWGGACRGTATFCRVRLDDVKGVKAFFARRP